MVSVAASVVVSTAAEVAVASEVGSRIAEATVAEVAVALATRAAAGDSETTIATAPVDTRHPTLPLVQVAMVPWEAEDLATVADPT